MVIESGDIMGFLGQFLWPWIRVSAMMLIAPLFANVQTPTRIRILLSVALTLAMLPVVGETPRVDPLSAQAVLIASQEVLVGVIGGFILAMAFNAVFIAGEAISLTMGLGFASMADPQSGVSVPVLSQFLQVIATILFLSLGGHLILLQILAASFETLPVGGVGLNGRAFEAIVEWGSVMFAGAVLLALPAIVVLLCINLTMGVMTRTAPQMNVFSVGFPVTMLLGFVAVLTLVMPHLTTRMGNLWTDAFQLTRSLIASGVAG